MTEQPKLLARAADLATAAAEIERLRSELAQVREILGDRENTITRLHTEIERLHAGNQQAWNECDAQDVARGHAVAEIERLRAQRDRLLAALNLTMLGGNHLASVLIGRLGGDFASRYPPDLDPEIALRTSLGSTDEYDVWCCWAAIMTARAAIAAVEEKT